MDEVNKSHTDRPRFIVIEGIDGSGKTTQAKRLVSRLWGAGNDALWTFEPSDGNVGRLIRRALRHQLVDSDDKPTTLDWVTLALLYAADRADHVHRTIRPTLDRGCWVVSDRYDLSSLAYQALTSGDAYGVLDWIRELNGRVPRPDLTIVVDVSAEVAAERRGARDDKPELFEVPETQRQLAQIYSRAEELVPHDRVVHIDGDRSEHEVAVAVWSAVWALEEDSA